MSRLRRHARSHRLLGALVLAAVAALLLQSASVPHTHAGIRPGLYNQDHDLALLATLHSAATLSGVQAAPAVLVAVTDVPVVGADRADSASPRSADSRAPPRS